MACHEIAGLRLGLMNVLGLADQGERDHELAEIGDMAKATGAVKGMVGASTLANLKTLFENSLDDLEQKTAAMDQKDPQLGYYRTLVVVNRKVEKDLANLTGQMQKFLGDLEELHDSIHEVYPVD